jgi:hypothetical protein
MLAHMPMIENALTIKPQTDEGLSRYFNLWLSYMEYISPKEINLETGRLIQLLCKNTEGLTREEILTSFYPNYQQSSFNRKLSLKVCLEKVIQRARGNFEKHRVTIYFCKSTKKYYAKLL